MGLSLSLSLSSVVVYSCVVAVVCRVCSMYVQGSHLFGVAKQLRIAFSKFFSDVVCSFAVRFFLCCLLPLN